MTKPFIRAYSFGEAKEIVNGKVVHDTAVKSEYNGQTLHVDKQDNNQLTHFILKGKELQKLLKKKTNQLSLLERLNADYMCTTKRMGTTKRKTGKRKNKKKQTRRMKRK